MCQFIETIRISKGIPQNLKYHRKRIEDTRKVFGISMNVDIERCLEHYVIDKNVLYKFRIVYSKNDIYSTLEEYFKKEISSLKILESDIDYSFKYENREKLSDLYSQKGNCDDILIVKNGLLTDTFFCNIALRNNESWFTPDSPLLKGTMRYKLLENKIIIEKSLSINDIQKYSEIALFNAMIPWEERICIPVCSVHK